MPRLTVINLTNSPFDLEGGVRLPAIGEVTEQFSDSYAELLYASPGVEVREAQATGGSDIASAIALLDAKNDDHWTNAGLPAVDAVSDLLGEKVTRAEIEAAAPDARRPE